MSSTDVRSCPMEMPYEREMRKFLRQQRETQFRVHTEARGASIDERIKKMWYVYTME